MTARARLPDRRAAETLDIETGGLRYTATVGFYPDGRLGEVFISTHKQGSQAGIMASDAAVVASIAIQHGVPVETLRRALMRDPAGRAIGPLGVVLDLVTSEEPAP
jgi:ribonucleoside-diphosphate reductase alpha chain